MKRIFPAIKLRPQTPPIDKREIGDAAITSPSAQLGPLANERAVSSDVMLWCCTFWSGKLASLSSYSIVNACSLYLVLWLCGGWRRRPVGLNGIMSTVPQEQQNVCKQNIIILLVHRRLVWRPVKRQLVMMSMIFFHRKGIPFTVGAGHPWSWCS